MRGDKYIFAHYLRAVAVISVMFAHFGSAFFNANAYLSSIINFPLIADTSYPGFTHLFPDDFFGFLAVFGVSIFFLISGFVIPISIEKHSIGTFILKRFLRLTPVYYFVFSLNLIIAAIGFWIYHTNDSVYPYSLIDIIKSYSLGLNNIQEGAKILDPVAWTLAIEILFYVISALFFLMSFKLRKKREIRLPDVMVLSLILDLLAIKLSKYHDLIQSHCYWINLGFIIKAICLISFMLIGTLFYLEAKKRITGKCLVIVLLIHFFAFVYVNMHLIPNATYIDPSRTFSWFGISLLVFSISYTLKDRLGDYNSLNLMANISYPLYLCHSYIGYLLMGAIINLQLLPRSLVVMVPFPFVIFSAWVIHNYIEIPCVKYKFSKPIQLSNNM